MSPGSASAVPSNTRPQRVDSTSTDYPVRVPFLGPNAPPTYLLWNLRECFDPLANRPFPSVMADLNGIDVNLFQRVHVAHHISRRREGASSFIKFRNQSTSSWITAVKYIGALPMMICPRSSGRQRTSPEVYGKWDGWPPHSGSKRLFLQRKYFLFQFEGPKQGSKRSGFLRTSLDAPGSKARDHGGVIASQGRGLSSNLL